MFARAAIAVSTGSDLVVKGAVDLVLLGSEDRSKVVGHGVLSNINCGGICGV